MLHSPYRPVRRASLKQRLGYFLAHHGVEAPLRLRLLLLFIGLSPLPLTCWLAEVHRQNQWHHLHGWQLVGACWALGWVLAAVYLLLELEVSDWRDPQRRAWTF